MKYKVQHDYQSNLASYDKGSTVELDEDFAAHVNRDSPGTLKPVKGKKAEKSEDEPKANAGTVDDILERVGDDAELAAEVLEAEQAEKNPRTTLVRGLEAVIAGPDDEDENDEGE